jgi:hypothetical protein
MTKENKSINKDMDTVLLSLAQIELIDLIQGSEVEDYLGTYCVGSELAELSASVYVHRLLDAIQKITIENR